MHKEWDVIEAEIDKRNHHAALRKIGKAPPKDKEDEDEEMVSRADVRLYGLGGAYHKILRDEYRRGLEKLETNSFENSAAKKEWETFRDKLTPEALAMVSDPKWS